MSTLSFEEVIALLNEPTSMDRTVTYITKRGCWAYRPMGGRPAEDLLEHVKEHQRACFNCDENETEYTGTCWGNMICEIWVCHKCAPTVQRAIEKARSC